MSSCMAFKSEGCGVAPGTAICLTGTQKILTEEEDKWSGTEDVGACVGSETWAAGSEETEVSRFLEFFSQTALEVFERQKAVEEEDAWEMFTCSL